MKYWLTYTSLTYPHDADLEVEFSTLDAALERVNEMGVGYLYRLIEGREIKLRAVEVVTRYEVER